MPARTKEPQISAAWVTFLGSVIAALIVAIGYNIATGNWTSPGPSQPATAEPATNADPEAGLSESDLTISGDFDCLPFEPYRISDKSSLDDGFNFTVLLNSSIDFYDVDLAYYRIVIFNNGGGRVDNISVSAALGGNYADVESVKVGTYQGVRSASAYEQGGRSFEAQIESMNDGECAVVDLLVEGGYGRAQPNPFASITVRSSSVSANRIYDLPRRAV